MVEGKKENGGKFYSLWTLMNSSSEGFVLCNSKGEITYFNQKASEIIKKISGHSLSSGDLFHYIAPEYARNSFTASFQNAIEGKSSEVEREIILNQDESFLFSVKYFPVQDTEGRNLYVCLLAKDITEERHFKNVINLQNEISGKLTGFENVEPALKYILDLAIDKTGMDCGGIYLRNEDTDTFDLIVHRGISENFVSNTNVLKPGSKKWDLIIKGNQIIKQHWEYETNPEDVLLKENLKLVVTTPVRYRESVLMSINIASHTKEYFPEMKNELLKVIANEAGSAIYRILTEEKLRQFLKKNS